MLIKIAEGLEEGELCSEINKMIEMLKKHERFVELEYKVRRLKSEFSSGESRYSDEIIQSSIEEREREMREIGDKSDQVIKEREKLLSRKIQIEDINEIETGYEKE